MSEDSGEKAGRDSLLFNNKEDSPFIAQAKNGLKILRNTSVGDDVKIVDGPTYENNDHNSNSDYRNINEG